MVVNKLLNKVSGYFKTKPATQVFSALNLSLALKLLLFSLLMGQCCTIQDENNSIPPNEAENKSLKTLDKNENNRAQIYLAPQIKDPWKYSSQLTIKETLELTQNSNISNTDIFNPPIKYGKVVSVYDGDTIHIVAPVFPGIIGRFKVRLAGIDAPELRTKNLDEKEAGYIAKDILSSKILNEIVELKNIKKDKYGRVLADIFDSNGINICKWLLNIGWALPYDGKGTKLVKSTNWKLKVKQYKQQLNNNNNNNNKNNNNFDNEEKFQV